ncbi:flagellar hook protein FlgE [Echinimonas agarilytica]|uniref:Flagellar hook protein FlgE n=1 Tax=Echinimonas agarilytica TaxID=1215918 RepID=A0AA42B780_9GAMM|nr:flagellar hook protein FlgE [Echinimonas agarilytica]MCM2678938.1 flagellar hook protein FlgE [Echinimonas agarilytica]
MSFNIALSGLNASQKDLDTTANNIANVNTYGFKESRAEFADVYSTSVFSNAKTKVGEGVTTSDIAQQFNQGSFLFTNNSLDMAVDGEGFFATSANPDDLNVNLTRAGAWKLDDNNFVVNSNGEFLRVFPVNPDGTVSSVALASTQPLEIPTSAGEPTQTALVDISVNLPSGAVPPDDGAGLPVPFDFTDPSSYNASTSVTTYDSLGQSYVMTTYYRKENLSPAPSDPNKWEVFYTVSDGTDTRPVSVDDLATGGSQGDVAFTDPNTGRAIFGHSIIFNTDGSLNSINGGNDVVTEELGVGGAGVNMGGADETQQITVNQNDPTQYASAFEVKSLSQDGITVGRLTGIDIGTNGLVQATYSNGFTEPLGKIALITVANSQGLAQIGNTSWQTTQGSGDPLAGEPDSGSYGKIRSGTIEQSNVNLTTELVDLITAQRNFQANSRALEVNNTITQNILQIR